MIVNFSIIDKRKSHSIQMPPNLLVAYIEERRRKIENIILSCIALIVTILLFFDRKLYTLIPSLDLSPLGIIGLSVSIICLIYWCSYMGPKNVLLLSCFSFEGFNEYIALVEKTGNLTTKQIARVESLYGVFDLLNNSADCDLRTIIENMAEYSEVFEIVKIKTTTREKASKIAGDILRSRFEAQKTKKPDE